MKILIENGCYHLRNMGDVAMLQVAVERLKVLWPEAEIKVLTDNFNLLKRYVPQAVPLDARGRHTWFHNGIILGRLYRFIPPFLKSQSLMLERAFLRRNPELALSVIRFRERLRGRDPHQLNAFMDAVRQADLLVVSGGGDLNDEFAEYAHTLLDVLVIAARFRVPVALFGQGVGPMKNARLLGAARRVLPRVHSIFVREKLKAPALMESLGVRPEQICVTGDDAIEMAYNARRSEMGDGIGVNLRLASYSAVGNNRLQLLQGALREAVDKYSATLIPMPISFHDMESDVKTIRNLLVAIDRSSDGGADLDSPQMLIEQVARCRIVITGSYHSAVFALSQGIPAVCLAKSAYYIDKFQGLADQFGCGCEVLVFDDELSEIKLLNAIDNTWNSAEDLRAELLEAALTQVEVVNAAYQGVYEKTVAGQIAEISGSKEPGLNPAS